MLGFFVGTAAFVAITSLSYVFFGVAPSLPEMLTVAIAAAVGNGISGALE